MSLLLKIKLADEALVFLAGDLTSVGLGIVLLECPEEEEC